MSAFTSDTPNQVCVRADELLPTAEDVLGWIESTLGTVGGWIADGFEWISSVFGDSDIGGIFSALSDALNEFNEFVSSLKEIAQQIFEFIKGVFMPWILPSYADKWREISDLMFDVSELTAPNGLRSPNSTWQGEAAQKYREFAAKSTDAAFFGSTIANQQADLLDDAAERGQAFYTALLGLIVSIILTILSVAAEAAAIVTIPAAIMTVLLEVVPLTIDVVILIEESVLLVQQQAQAFETMTSNLEAATAHFPGGNWPPVA